MIAGATGFVGGRLAAALAGSGPVRCLVREPSRAAKLEALGAELRIGDVTDASSLVGVGEGVDVAYYLVHAMAGGAGFEERERVAAGNFARMAKREGVGRVVYLGGLGQETESKHLRSRHETARILVAEGPPLTYFRAAMVVGDAVALGALAGACHSGRHQGRPALGRGAEDGDRGHRPKWGRAVRDRARVVRRGAAAGAGRGGGWGWRVTVRRRRQPRRGGRGKKALVRAT